MTKNDCNKINKTGKKTCLYGANLQGIFPVTDFLFDPITDSQLHIVYTGSKDHDPIHIVVAEKDSNAYSLNVKDAIRSKDFVARLGDDDKEKLTNLASLVLPKADYSNFVWRNVMVGGN